MPVSSLLAQQIRRQLGAGIEYPTPGHMARALNPKTVQTPALDLIDAAIMECVAQPDGRLIISMPPQEGKSERTAIATPIWALHRNPDLRIAGASYAQGLANRNGRAVRNHIVANPQLGMRIADDNGAAGEWQLAGHAGGVLSVGRGAGIVGRPVDLLIIDDPVKDRSEAESETVRQTCWDWWTDSLSTRLSPGASVILIMTRWHEDDLAGRLLAAEDGHLWRVLNIPAQCDDPATDPLGRIHGEYMVSARGRTAQQWAATKVRVGSRTWGALYQGQPSPAEGGLIKRDWWRRYSTPLWTERPDGTLWADMDEVLISADLTFKGTETSDFVAIGVWGRRGSDIYLLDQIHGWHDFVSTLRVFEALCRKWPQATLKLVEDKANGPALISMLARRIVGIVPITPHGSKVARAAAWAPLCESGHMWIPEPGSIAARFDVSKYLDEVASFPTGKHDDQVDQTSQAADRLLLRPLVEEWTQEAEDYDDYRIGY